MGHNWLCCFLLLSVTAVRYTLSEDLKDTSSYDPCECPGGDFSRSCVCVYIRNCNSSNYIKTHLEDAFAWRSGVTLRKNCKGGEKCCFAPDDDYDEDKEDGGGEREEGEGEKGGGNGNGEEGDEGEGEEGDEGDEGEEGEKGEGEEGEKGRGNGNGEEGDEGGEEGDEGEEGEREEGEGEKGGGNGKGEEGDEGEGEEGEGEEGDEGDEGEVGEKGEGEEGEKESSTVKKESTTSTTIRAPPSTKVPEDPPVMIELPPENTKGGCGVRRVFPSDRIYSSNPSTSFGQFPWMVAVYLRTKIRNRWEFHCGGSLISHKVVLTAAHCVHGHIESEIIVRAGDWDLISRAEPEKREDRRVKKIIRHENFQPPTLVNDVALLVLNLPLPRKIHIDTICLPEKGTTFAGQRCIVTGWGSKQGGKMNYTTTLSQVELPVLEHKKCRDMLRKTILGRYFRLDKSFLCAGGEENNGACLQDGGGPLICESDKDSDRYYQAGVVAGGLACGVKDIPDVYANVAYLSDWIKDRLDEQDLDNEAIHP